MGYQKASITKTPETTYALQKNLHIVNGMLAKYLHIELLFSKCQTLIK